VETAEQLAELRHLRCDFAQGYLWSRPLAPAVFTAWMNDHGRRALVPTARP
jgi:EAL domain-containing protein (putative c-di-GMP-specific phosphodiesterase class I)